MPYSVKEIFYTLQGEGAQAGSAAVFLRFSGCNLWNGRSEDRKDAICKFCDTDFVGTDGINGGKYSAADDLATCVRETWKGGDVHRLVVCTGGEPLLQLDEELIRALQSEGFKVAVETNGTLPVPRKIDWICVSPKFGSKLVQTSGNELKLVFPQDGIDPKDFENLEFDHFFLQPMFGEDTAKNTEKVVEYCLSHPRWRCSIQSHKIIGIP